MPRYDVVVVGGGPAGATSARVLAEAGVRVLLLEKKRIPRFKLCAGCLSARIEGLLPEGWRRLVLNDIKGGLLGFRGENYLSVTSERPVAYIVDRSDFDSFLVEVAVSSGSELWDGAEFIDFEEGFPLKVRTSRGTVQTDFLIGADGFYTRVGKLLGYRKGKFFRSIEFWTEGTLEDRVVIDIGLVRRGYGWVFPKGDRSSVGIASYGSENLIDVLKSYASATPYLNGKAVKGTLGWMIPFAEREEDLHLGKGRVALVGDAANMVDPLLGEGIYYGVLGGKILAEAFIEDPARVVDLYRKKVNDIITPELAHAAKIARLAYRFQRVAFRMGDRAILGFLGLLEGRTTYQNLYKKGLVDFLISLLNFENFLHIIIDKILRRRW